MSKNRYQINKLLGKGRTGGVYEAEDSKLQRKVAVRRFFDAGNNVDLLKHKEDFLREAQSLSNLHHPNLLSVFDAGMDDDGAYIVSQLLEGDSLHDETQKGAMKVEEVVELAKQLLDAFSVAHDIGYCHGALTPGSILMTPRARGGYRYVILDMGLSRLAPLIHGEDSVLAVMADPAILAPELFSGGVADEQSDLYMLGQILYLCLAGSHPFGGVDAKEAHKKHLKGLPSIKKYNKFLHKNMVSWLNKLTAVNPENRPASAIEALKLLSKIPVSTFKTPAKLTKTGVTPVFKSNSALSAIVESGPVKKMTTALANKSDSKVDSSLILITEKSDLEDPIERNNPSSEQEQEAEVAPLLNTVPFDSALSQKKSLLELIIATVILIVIGVIIVLVMLVE